MVVKGRFLNKKKGIFLMQNAGIGCTEWNQNRSFPNENAMRSQKRLE